jgi:NAD(P)-dependent dehydrogenase (short-subunit alcohol dehydrogenase family)
VTYATKGVRVNCVAPGLTETPLSAHLVRDDTTQAATTALHPMRTLAGAGDVASAVVWLLDPDQRVVTGQVVGVDAGLGAVHRR